MGAVYSGFFGGSAKLRLVRRDSLGKIFRQMALLLGDNQWRVCMSDLNDQHHDQFLRLFAEYEPALRTFVRSLLPSRGDASEVMQEVAVVLWQKFGEFDAARDFRKWAYGVARYEALAYRRDRVRDRHVFDDELVGRLARMPLEAYRRAVAGPEGIPRPTRQGGCL